MGKSIFSNLPNNLIMNIIKMAEDERKKEEKENHQKKFIDVMNQFNKVEEDLLEHYSREERDQYETEYYIGTNQRRDPAGGYILADLFQTIDEINALMEVKYYEDYAFSDDPEYRYETRYNNEGNEWDYDWGDDDEPSWACE